MPALTALTGHSVALKCEQMQPIGAFKVRGAYNAIQRMPTEARARGVITYSSGNHGLAVAWAASKVGVRAVIVMPDTAPQVKVDGVREARWRGGVRGPPVAGPQGRRRRRSAPPRGWPCCRRSITPMSSPGRAPVALEILEQWPHVETILVPVGGGGLLAGICVAVAGMHPEVKVVAVEPEARPS